jgi:hypothetical protein
MHGTSFAAPVVAGALAAIRSYSPDRSAVEAEQLLLETARRGEPEEIPALDTSAALRAIGRGAIVDAYVPRLPPETQTRTELAVNAAQDRTDAFGGDASAFWAGFATRPQVSIVGARAPRVPTPKVTVRRLRGGRALLRARNRPAAAIFDVRAGARSVGRESARITLVIGKASVLKARFVTEHGASPWARVSIKAR